MTSSRTSKSIKNSVVSLIFYGITLIVQFYARKIFLIYLGTEILGLNTTAQNILEFLNLAELGIGSAVGYFLYKPLRENDVNSINEIVTLQGILYKRIAMIIIACSLMILPFFPLIFKKINLPLWYAYISFGVFLFGALLGYFFNYRQIVLSANQQNYKIKYSYNSILILRSIAQIFVVSFLPNPFIWWIIVYALFTVIGTISLHFTTKRAHPYLKSSPLSYRRLTSEYPDFSKKIKQIFFHKIGGFVLTQSSPLILYAYASLTMVALYGNYMMIINGVIALSYSVFNSIDAGIGNLVAEGNKKKIILVFKELFSIRFTISTIIIYLIYYLTPQFISIWIGKEYILSNYTLGLLTAILYIRIFRATIDSFNNAYGLYSDVYAPVIEAIINIGLSIFLGYYYGLNGILWGVLISLIIIIVCWKPYYLFKKGLKFNLKWYVKLYLKHIVCALICWMISNIIIANIPIPHSNEVYSFLICVLLRLSTITVLLVSVLWVTTSGINETMKRLKFIDKTDRKKQ